MVYLRKVGAVALVGVMIVSGLAAILNTPIVNADTIIPSTSNRFAVIYNAATMYAELVYDKDPSDNSGYLLGEANDASPDRIAGACQVNVQIRCLMSFQVSEVWLNATSWGVGLDVQDNDTTNTHIPGGAGAWNPPSNGTTQTFVWKFDVLKTIGLGVDTATDIQLLIWFNENGMARSSTFTIRIYLSSIFDDPATETHEILPDVIDATGGGDDTRFEAGDMFEAATLSPRNYDSDSIGDTECWLIPPPMSGITLRQNLAWIPNSTAAGAFAIFSYRADVAAQTLPGIYLGMAWINYTRNDAAGFRITEPARNCEFEIDYNFRDTNPVPVGVNYSEYQCWSPNQITVQNGTGTKIIVVEVENNGNSVIENFAFRIEPQFWQYYFMNCVFIWNDSGIIYRNTVTNCYPSLAIGESIQLQIETTLDPFIPIGMHTKYIRYDGYYFNNGSLLEPTGYYMINGGNGVPDGMDDLSIAININVIQPEIKPDLIITSISTFSDDIYVTVKNQGTKIISNNFFIELFINPPGPPSIGDFGNYSERLTSLGIGESTTVIFFNTLITNSTVYAIVDTDDRVAESLENNNIYGPEILLLLLDGPDLTITSIFIDNDYIWVTVLNNGTNDVIYNFYVELFIDPVPSPNVGEIGDYYQKVLSLPAGQCANISFDCSLTGEHEFYSIVDTDDRIIESNESNNIFGPVTFILITLNHGWNLISLPLIQENESIEFIFNDIQGDWGFIRTYNATDITHWKSNSNLKPAQLNDLTTINNKEGFWIYITVSTTTLAISGEIPTQTTINLQAGWNLVGYPSHTQKTIFDALIGTNYDAVEGFNPLDPFQTQVLPNDYVMQPGEGYWVHVPSDTNWVVYW